MGVACDITFHPGWWHKQAGICFSEEFFFNPDYRIEADLKMRQVLYEKFGFWGLGKRNPEPRPIVGTDLLASGFLYSGIMGCPIKYSDANPPEVIGARLDDSGVRRLAALDLRQNEMWQKTISQFELLEEKFGFVESHINLQGVLNLALDLRGSDLFIDFFEDPELAEVLLAQCTRISLEIGRYLASKSKCLSHGVTAITSQVMPEVYLTSNCTVEMVSLETYEEFLLKHDQLLAEAFQPFGIHHCGKTMEHVASGYAKIPGLQFAEVGAGSDIGAVRRALPGVFLNLRYSPVRLKTVSREDLIREVREMAEKAGSDFSISCVGIDAGTDDRQVEYFLQAVADLLR